MTPDQKYAYARSFSAHVGVDTGKFTHALVVRRADGIRSAAHTVRICREDFETADRHILTLLPGLVREQVLIGLEFAGQYGFTFAHFLAARGYPIVTVLPSVTKKTKEIEDNSPLKTDAKDAALICKLTSDGSFVRFPFLDPVYAALRQLTTERHRLSVEATRYKNRLKSLLDLTWPEFLPQFKEYLMAATPLAILDRWPLPEDLLRAPRRAITATIKRASRNHVTSARIQALIDSARETVGLKIAGEERRLELQHTLARLLLLREQVAELDVRLAAAVELCPAARAVATVPEVGVVCAATIVAEIGMPEDYESPRQILKLAGMNLIERSSGLLKGRKRQSKRGRPLLRRQLYLLAGRWCREDRGRYRTYYDAYVARNGGLRTKAVCAVARKLVPLLLAVMKSGETFDETRWVSARHRMRCQDGAAAMSSPSTPYRDV